MDTFFMNSSYLYNFLGLQSSKYAQGLSTNQKRKIILLIFLLQRAGKNNDIFSFIIAQLLAKRTAKKEATEITLTNPINPKVLGFNTGYAFYHGKPDAPYKEFEEFTKRLNPKILRFPGGTIANFYHPDFPGYGLKEVEILKYVKKKEQQGFLDHIIDDAEYPNQENVIQPFIRLVKATNAEVLYVANLFTGNYEEVKTVLKTFQKNGINLNVELGNEYYLNKYIKSVTDPSDRRFEGVNDYIAQAKGITEEIKKDFPEIKVGIVAAPPSVDQGLKEEQRERNLEWNREIIKYSFYDAVVVHHYAKNKISEHIPITPTARAIWANKYLNEGVVNYLPQIFEEWKSLFPQKNIWITEYNSKDLGDGIKNSMVSILYLAHYVMEMVKFNARGTNFIEKMCIHNLLGGGKGFPLISPEKKQDPSFAKDIHFTRRTTYFLFDLLKHFLNDKMTFLQSSNFYSLDSSNLVFKYNFLNQEKPVILICIINKSNKPNIFKLDTFHLKIRNSLYQIRKDPKAQHLYSINASQLVAGIGKNEFLDKPETLELSNTAFSKSVVIPKWSINRIQIPIQKI